MRTLRWTTAIVLMAALAFASTARALSLQHVGSFDQPIYLTSDPGNANRIFVVERKGIIELVQNGSVSTFANLTSVVDCCNGERGLLSMALPSDFDTTGRFYVDYTGVQAPGEIHVAELLANGNSASISTLRNVLIIPHPDQDNHNGGQLQFGPDGDLYISTGDGGGGNDQFHNAQNLGSLLGKILRIDPRPDGVDPYTVPADNPFTAAGPPFDTVWSYGLRNPFRFSFDQSAGDMLIGDVGQNAREEIDYAPAPGLGRGANYGWNCREGLIAGFGDDPGCSAASPSAFADPVFDYPHNDPGGGAAHGCAIIGGYVVRDPSLGDLYGRYLYGDLCAGDLRSLELSLPAASGDRSEGLHVDNLNSFGEDSCGRLYTVSGDGEVDRLVGSSPRECASALAPAPGKTQVRVKAIHRTVKRGGMAFIIAWVSPCEGRQGQLVRLNRGGQPNGTKRLSHDCSAKFHRRISHRSTFRVTSFGDDSHLAATSRRLTIRAKHAQ